MKHPNLFHNTSLRLTAIYLCIIMFISLIFSIGLYRTSSAELERSIRRPEASIEKYIRGQRNPEINALIQEFVAEQDQALKEAQNRLKADLLLINLAIFVFGGLTSYFLARRTLKPIEEAHEAQSRFTADASHELRTPITAMRAETELTLTEPKLSVAIARKQLESNIEELDKLTALSEGLLQLARLDNNNIEKELVTVDHIVQQAIDRVLSKAEQKKQTITPKNIVDLNINVNQLAVVEALVTLLDNAIKYSPTKSDITIATKAHQKTVDISVIDHGIGMKSSELPHVFDRFYRADSSRTKSGEHGYGIGLSIAKSVADAHSGTINVKSTAGKGSTFTITLPVK